MKSTTQATKRHVSSSRISKLERENAELKKELAIERARTRALEQALDEQKEVARGWKLQYQNLQERSTTEIQQLQAELRDLKQQMAELRITLAHHTKQAFGERTEQTIPAAEPDLCELKTKGKKPGSPGFGRKSRDGLVTSENEIEVPADKRTCACCGKAYRKLKGGDRSEMIELIQDLVRIVDIGQKFVKDCNCDEGDKPRFVSSEPPPRVFPRALMGPALWTDILVEKFLFQKPLVRISAKYGMLGAELAVSTICSGMKKLFPAFADLYEEIKKRAKTAKRWNMDETTWRVFGSTEENKKHRWWLWVVVTEDCWVYLLDPSRSSSVPTLFFNGVSEGVIVTDRYSAYKSLQGLSKAYCWAHVRRDFIKIHEGAPKYAAWADEWIKDINELYHINNIRLEMIDQRATDEVDLARHELLAKLSRLKIKAVKGAKTAPTERQKKVLRSLVKHWDGLTIFVEQPEVPMDNNGAERALRTPVVGRKNYYGSGSAESGSFAAIMFTISQTWLCNKLDPIRMMQDFLTRMAEARGQPPPLDDYLPWRMDEHRKREFKLSKNV